MSVVVVVKRRRALPSQKVTAINSLLKNLPDLLRCAATIFEGRDTRHESQPEFWIEARRLPEATASTFYRKLDATLESIGFTIGLREICRPASADAAKSGRPGIGPAVYFKMLMIGFFEKLPSERLIASGCAGSHSLRAFLGNGLEEKAPDHSSLSVIGSPLGAVIFQEALDLVLRALHGHGLLKGRQLSASSPA